jgi:hypothetical protein
VQEQSNSWFNKALLIFVPFMVGWFALNLPAGLGLYYFSNTMITSGIQIWLRKLGGTLFWILLHAWLLGIRGSSGCRTRKAWSRWGCLTCNAPYLENMNDTVRKGTRS